MLKWRAGNQTWLISQPDHAAVSGYLAAHWGNEAFSRPGYYSPSPQSELWRSEAIFAIAEHDNGWWEWEADPEIDPEDGLPLHLTGLTQQQGFDRWRLGVARFERKHPYAALLISLHAYWLHVYRCETGVDESFRHPLFGSPGSWPPPAGVELEQTKQFVGEQKAIQQRLIARMSRDPEWSAAVEPPNLNPHARLLQLMDAFSLALCFGGKQEAAMDGIPRRGWDDRVSLALSPLGDKRIAIAPYPFDQDPLPVALRARVLTDQHLPPKAPFQAWWQSIPRTHLRFEYCSVG